MGIRDTISLLTIIPAGGHSIEKAGKTVYLFPVVGMMVGVIAGTCAMLVGEMSGALIGGVAAAASLAVITGMHHIDGLADFADGLMVKGDAAGRIRVMRDKITGSAGICAILLCVICVVAAVAKTEGLYLLLAVITAEVAAKYGMVIISYAGRPAAKGSGAILCNATDSKRMICATLVWLVPVVLAAIFVAPPLDVAWYVMPPFVAVSVSALIILCIARYRFGGITGDVIGATNEIGRAAALAAIVAV